jgi:hypothetical protein
LGTKPRTIIPYDYDFISYDFLKQISPQPELFELRRVLAIPKEDIEARHDYMLSVIKDRIDNADVYEREYFSKYPHYGYSRRKMGFNIDNLWELKKKKYFPERRRMSNFVNESISVGTSISTDITSTSGLNSLDFLLSVITPYLLISSFSNCCLSHVL